MAIHGIYGSVANQSTGGIPQTGLIAEWLFTSDASDTTGNHDGSFVGDAQIDSGSLLLDGTDRVGFANSASFASGTGAFSYQTWVNATTITGARNYLAWSSAAGGTQFASDSGDMKLVMNGTTLFSGGTTLTTSTWYMLVYTMDGSGNWKIYLDKVQDNTASNGLSVGTPNHANGMMIGAEATALMQYWHGRIGASRYWVGYELTTADIAAIWDLEKASYT